MRPIQKIMLLSCLLLAVTIRSYAQYDEYKNLYLGWMKMFDPKEVRKPYSNKERSYTAKQISIGQTLTCWLQQSYTPKGGLGKAAISLNQLSSEYSDRERSLEQMYGAIGYTFLFLKKGPGGKWTPETTHSYVCSIMANGSFGDYVDILCSEKKNYFYFSNEVNMNDMDRQDASTSGFDKDPVLKKYISWYEPNSIRNTRRFCVLLCRNNEKPYVVITKGEFLDEVRSSIDRDFKEKIRLINEQHGHNPSDVTFFTKQEKDNLTRRLAAYDKLRKKYSAQLNEPAAIRQEQPNLLLENNSFDYFDPAEGARLHYVYKIRPEIFEKTFSDTPQWILLKWDAPGVLTDDAVGLNMHESMLFNIDYDYIYNYFFDPVKVAGKAYQPRRSPVYEAKTVKLETSAATKKISGDPNVVFFDDYSQDPAGAQPSGWNMPLNTILTKGKVVNLPNENVKWLEIKGHNDIRPKAMPVIPSNFTMEFDLAVLKDIPWGTKAFELRLGTNTAFDSKHPFYEFRFRAGFMGRPGEITINGGFGKGYAETVNAEATGLSNDKCLNKVHVRLERDGERMRLSLDGKTVADIPKACPASSVFTAFSIGQLNSDNDLQKYFISNFRITKK